MPIGQYDATLLLNAQVDTNQLFNQVSNIAAKIKPINIKINGGGALGQISKDSAEFNKSLAASTSRVLAFGVSAGAVFAVTRAFKETLKSTIEVQKSLAELNIVFQISENRLNKLSDSLFDTANKTGQSWRVAGEALLEFGRQGLSVEESLKRTKSALELTRFTGLETADAVRTITTALNSFNEAGLDSAKILDKISNVDVSFAVSGKDLAEGLARVSSIAKDAGINIDKLFGLITSAKQNTGRTGEVIATSIGTIIQRLGRGDSLDNLRELGVVVDDVNGQFLSTDKILQNLAKTFDSLSQSQQNSVVQFAGGVRNANTLRALLGDLAKANSVYEKATITSANASGYAAERNEELNKTLSSQLNTLLNNVTKAGAGIGNLTLKPLIERLAVSVNKSFSELGGQIGEGGIVDAGVSLGTGLLKGLGNYLNGPGLVAIATLAGKLFIGFGQQAAKSFATILESGAKQVQITAAINSLLAQQPELNKQISSGQLSQLQIQEAILASIRLQNLEYAKQGQVFNATKGLLSAGSLKLSGGNLSLGSKVPNFANPVSSAIIREAQAGVPKSLIRVGQSTSLKNSQNPLGLGVYNLRDEPGGLNQGVSRALSEGSNPKNYGIPNFANTFGGTFGVSQNGQLSFLELKELNKEIESYKSLLQGGIGGQKELNSATVNLANKYELTSKAMTTVANDLKTSFNTFKNSTITNPARLLDSPENTKARLNERIRLLTLNNEQPRSVFLDENLDKRRVINLKGPLDSDFEKERIRQQAKSFRYTEYEGRTYKSDYNFPSDSLAPLQESKAQQRLAQKRQDLIQSIREKNEQIRLSQTLNLPSGTFGPSRGQFDYQQGIKSITQEELRKQLEIKNSLDRVRASITPSSGGFSNDELLQRKVARQQIINQRNLELNRSREIERQTFSASRFGGLGSFFGQGKQDFNKLPQAIQSQLTQSLQNKAFLASIVAPLIGGVAQESFGDKTKTARGLGQTAAGLGNVVGFGATGFALSGGNPLGLAAGISIGLLLEAPKAIKAFSDTLPDLAKRLGELQDVSQKTSASFISFTDLSQKLFDINSGSVQSTVGQKKILERERGNALSDIPSGARQQIIEAAKNGDFGKISDISNNFTQNNLQKVAFANSLLGLSQFAEKNPIGNSFGQRIDASYRTYSSNNNGNIVLDKLQNAGAALISPFEALGSYISASGTDAQENVLSSDKELRNFKRNIELNKLTRPIVNGVLDTVNLKNGKSARELFSKDDFDKIGEQFGKSPELGIQQLSLRFRKQGIDPSEFEKNFNLANDEAKQAIARSFNPKGGLFQSNEKLKEDQKIIDLSVKKIQDSLYALNKALIESQNKFENLGSTIEINGIKKVGELNASLQTKNIRLNTNNQISLLTNNGENLKNLFDFRSTISGNENQATLGRAQLQQQTGKSVFDAIGNLRVSVSDTISKKLEEGKFKGEDIKERINKILNQFDTSFQPFIDKLEKGEPVTEQFLKSLSDVTTEQLKKAEESKASSSSNTIEEKSTIDELSKFLIDLNKNKRNLRVGSSQISSDLTSGNTIAREQFLNRRRFINADFNNQQNVSRNINQIDISVIARQAALARQQLGARPETLIALQSRNQLTGVAGNLLSGAIEKRPLISNLGLNINNLDSRLPNLISEQKKSISELKNVFSETGNSTIQEELEKEEDTLNSLIDLQNKYNNEKDKQTAIQLEALRNLKTELAFSSDRLNVEKRINEENSRKGDFKAVNNNLGNTLREGFSFNSNDFWKQMSDNAASFGDDFKNAFKGGVHEAITGAKSVGDAFKGVLINFGTGILDKFNNLAIDTLFGALFGNQKVGGGSGIISGLFTGKANGGVVNRFAKGGYVNMGSGTKDDVPALLSGGEFVVKKSSVNKIGLDYLNQINSDKSLPRQVDSLSISGNSADVLLANEYYGIGSKTRPKKGQSNVSNLLSSFGQTDENNPQNSLKFSREKYFVDLKQYQKRLAKAKTKFEQQQNFSLISAYISAGINVGGAALGGAGSKDFTGTGAGNVSENDLQAAEYFQTHGSISPHAMGGIIRKYARGGNVFGGDSFKDNIPAYLMGGEFVVNKNSVNRIGLDKLNYMNRTGKIAGYANGGYVGTSSYGNGTSTIDETTNKYFSELISINSQIRDSLNNKNTNTATQATTGGGGININNQITVNIADNGKITSSNTSQTSENDNNRNKKDNKEEQGKQISKLLDSAITNALIKESKDGGILSSFFKKK